MSSARLERIAAASKRSEAQIVKLRSPSAIEVCMWLCEKHVATNVEQGWVLVDSREPSHNLYCQECDRDRVIARAEADAAKLGPANDTDDPPF